MIKCISVISVIIVTMLFSVGRLTAQDAKPSFAVGFDMGVQMPFCDISPAGLALAGEAQMRFLLSDRFNIGIGLGYGQLADGFSKRTFHTNVINADLKGNIYLLTQGKFRPYATLGVGGLNYTYFRDKDWAIGSTDLEGKPFWDVNFFYGGGFDLYLSKSVALTTMAEYRFTTTDGLDGAVQGTSKDGFLNVRTGLVFLMGEKAARASEEQQIASSERGEVVTQLPPEEEPMDEATAAILRQLGAFEGEETPANAETAVAATTQRPTKAPETQSADELKTRAESLRALIKDRDNEISVMQSQIQMKDSRITELQRELAQVKQSPTDFSSSYQDALRNFGTKNYDRSIEIFTSLRNSYPQHKLTGNCIYWIGENYFAKGDYAAAINAFTSVLSYSQSYKLDDATLMLGRCHQKLGQLDQAKAFFNQLINQYPSSEYVPKAQQWLQRLP
ncbi:MAG: tol-pal system protein YbgF [Calditrichaeota bacterium]|nr:MAG: tol-pal system protein YbgF [Calditrichota bacterium]